MAPARPVAVPANRTRQLPVIPGSRISSPEPDSPHAKNSGKLKSQFMAGPESVTMLLKAWSHGDQEALGKLTPLVYAEASPPGGPLLAQPASRPYLAGDCAGP